MKTHHLLSLSYWENRQTGQAPGKSSFPAANNKSYAVKGCKSRVMPELKRSRWSGPHTRYSASVLAKNKAKSEASSWRLGTLPSCQIASASGPVRLYSGEAVGVTTPPHQPPGVQVNGQTPKFYRPSVRPSIRWGASRGQIASLNTRGIRSMTSIDCLLGRLGKVGEGRGPTRQCRPYPAGDVVPDRGSGGPVRPVSFLPCVAVSWE